jgi:L-lactate dehydrogenase
LRAKGATYYGIAAALVRIVRSILRNEHAVLTVSSLIPPSLGMGEVCLSLPSVIDRGGVGRTIVPRLSPKEEQALKESAEAVKRHMAAIC